MREEANTYIKLREASTQHFLVMCRTVPRRRARSSPRPRRRATRQQQVPERPSPERRRPLPTLRRGGLPGGLQAQHAPHHLDVVVPAGLHVPVEVHDPGALCVAGNAQRKAKRCVSRDWRHYWMAQRLQPLSQRVTVQILVTGHLRNRDVSLNSL